MSDTIETLRMQVINAARDLARYIVPSDNIPANNLSFWLAKLDKAEGAESAHENAGQAAVRASGEAGQRAPVAPDGWRKKFFDALPKWFDEDARHTAYSKIEPLIDQLAAAPSSSEAAPFAYACPANCGCIWRDNKDGTMSLFGKRSQSCEVCEPSPLSALIPLYLAGAPTAASEQGES